MAVSSRFLEENLTPSLNELGSVTRLVIIIPNSKANTTELAIGTKGATINAVIPMMKLNKIPANLVCIIPIDSLCSWCNNT